MLWSMVIAGLILGSFLNVCIYRIPRGLSVVRPGSACPHCGRPIRPWENIPVLSYVLLGGRCRGCRGGISWIYPFVEILTAVSFAALYWRFGWSAPLGVNAVFFCLLIVLVMIDLTDRILPDVFTVGGTVAGLLLVPWQAPEFFTLPGSPVTGEGLGNRYAQAGLGILLGAGFLWLVAWLYRKFRGVEGMGMGDVKMMAMVGAFLGWQMVWLTILLGSLMGAVVGGSYVWLTGRGRRYELPFGSFLGISAAVAALFGPQLVLGYLALLQS